LNSTPVLLPPPPFPVTVRSPADAETIAPVAIWIPVLDPPVAVPPLPLIVMFPLPAWISVVDPSSVTP
jgi:hypothetical protein